MFAYFVKWLSQFSGICTTQHGNEPRYKKCIICSADYCGVCMQYTLAIHQIYVDIDRCKNCYKL